MRPTVVVFAAAYLALTACGDGPREANVHRHHHPAPPSPPLAGITEAVAVMVPTEGNRVAGVLRFREVTGTVVISGDVSGLTADGRHAIHIHEFGDASAIDGAAAGDHYNPENHPHGGLDRSDRHAGDLGNLLADAGGMSHVEISVDNLTIAGARNPIIGRAVVIHAKADDLTSQPAGNAGPRIAVGVIGVAKPTAKP